MFRQSPVEATRRLCVARSAFALILVSCVINAAFAQEDMTSEKPSTDPRPATNETGKGLRSIEGLSVPANAILVLCEEAKNLGLLPKAVVLTPEKYQELLDQVEQLRKQLKPSRPENPSLCKLTGQVDGDLVRFQATFEFRTEKPRTAVLLGCQRAWPRSAALDGALPLITTTEEGLVVMVESAGAHQVIVELEAPLVTKGSKGQERGFDIGLPRAAITTLEGLSLPPGPSEVRVNGRGIRVRPAAPPAMARVDGVLLGAAERLEVSWKNTIPETGKGPSLATVEARFSVRVEEPRVTTEAELNLQVLRGEKKEWKIQVPVQAAVDIKEPTIQDERIEEIIAPDGKNGLLTIRLKEPGAQPLRVVLQLRQPRRQGAMGVGAVSVQEAFRQFGTIALSAPPELRLRFAPRIDLSQRDLTDEQRKDQVIAAFAYWNLPAPAGLGQPAPAPLDVEAEPVKGALECRVDHLAKLVDSDWQLTSRFDVTPIRSSVDRLEIQVPADYPFDAERGAFPSELVEDVTFDPRRRLAIIKLAQKQSRPFSVALPALVPLASDVTRCTLDLPRMTNALDRGASAMIILPEGLELQARDFRTDSADRRRFVRSWERAPGQLELSWKRQRLVVQSIADIHFVSGAIRVRQRMQVGSPNPVRTPLRVEPPAGLPLDRVRLVQGGRLESDGSLELDAGDGAAALVLEYRLDRVERFPTIESPSVVNLPMARIEGASHEFKARLWSEGRTRLSLIHETWEDLPTELVVEEESLPTLVARARREESPLQVLVHESDEAGVGTPLRRGLVEVVLDEDGGAAYRVRLVVRGLPSRRLGIHLPPGAEEREVEFRLQDRIVPWSNVEADASPQGTTYYLDIEPELYHGDVLVEVRYETPPSAQWRFSGVATLQPPVLAGQVLLGRIRWRVACSPRVAAFMVGSQDISSMTWRRRSTFAVPQFPSRQAALENWLLGDLDPHLVSTVDPHPDDSHPASTYLHVTRTDGGPVYLVYASAFAWMTGCSGLALLALFAASYLGRRFSILVGAGGAAALVALAHHSPGALVSVLYGVQPVALILTAFGILYVGWRWIRERQAKHLPGFRRTLPVGLSSGSSIARPPALPVQREPSTVDAHLERDAVPRT